MRTEAQRLEYNAKRRNLRPHLSKICTICQTEFKTKRKTKFTCSRKCWVKHWARDKGKTYFRKRYIEHRERFLAASIRHSQNIKDKCYLAYGGYICVCCGELNRKFLTLDHIYNDGAEHRKKLGKSANGNGLYRWAAKAGFPPIFQVLCYNCNCGKNVNNGVCPHKDAT